MIYIVMYHYVRDLKHSRYPGIKGLDIELFRQQIDFLKENFSIITMEEMLAAVDGQLRLPEKSVLLTFDDGYVDDYTYILPVLEEAKVQGSFFIPGKTLDANLLLDVNKIHYILACADVNQLIPDVFERMNNYRESGYLYPSNEELFEKYAFESRFDRKETIFVKRMLQTVLPEEIRNRISSELFQRYVDVSEKQLAKELYMTRDQIRTMKRHGMYIGIHGYDHYWLGNLQKEQMEKDISRALEVMDEFIDKNAWVMNYPYGNQNEAVVEFIKSKGCKMGLTTEVGVTDFAVHNRYLFPRLDCNDFPPKSENYKKQQIKNKFER